MKTFQIFVMTVVLAAFVGLGCGGGGATLDTCVTEYTKYLKKQGGGQMPDDAAKQGAEAACQACKTDKKACKLIVDNIPK